MRTLASIEKVEVLRAICDADFDVAAAAERLGISRRTVYRMLARWGLEPPVGGNPGAVLWSERQRRCEKISRAINKINEEEVR